MCHHYKSTFVFKVCMCKNSRTWLTFSFKWKKSAKSNKIEQISGRLRSPNLQNMYWNIKFLAVCIGIFDIVTSELWRMQKHFLFSPKSLKFIHYKIFSIPVYQLTEQSSLSLIYRQRSAPKTWGDIDRKKMWSEFSQRDHDQHSKFFLQNKVNYGG